MATRERDIVSADGKSLQERIDGILNCSEIASYLNQYTTKADRAKMTSTICGFLAIVLGSLAIVLAAIEIITELPEILGASVSEAARDTQASLQNKACSYGNLNRTCAPLAIGFSAAVFGLISMAIASIGLLFGPRKQEWLRNRFRGERIRQFHYQSLIHLLPQIAAYLQDGTKQKQEEFENKQRRLFEKFKRDFDNNFESKYSDASKYGDTSEDSAEEDCWLVPMQPESLSPIWDHSANLNIFLDEYKRHRIEHQINYVTSKLRDDYKLFSSSPVRQAKILNVIAAAGVAWLLLIHTAALVLVALTLVGSLTALGPLSIVFSVAIITIAVVALATRALEQGLQPEREFERYRQFKVKLTSIRKRFTEAKTVDQKVSVMRQMECAAFDELVIFIVTHERDSFAL